MDLSPPNTTSVFGCEDQDIKPDIRLRKQYRLLCSVLIVVMRIFASSLVSYSFFHVTYATATSSSSRGNRKSLCVPGRSITKETPYYSEDYRPQLKDGSFILRSNNDGKEEVRYCKQIVSSKVDIDAVFVDPSDDVCSDTNPPPRIVHMSPRLRPGPV